MGQPYCAPFALSFSQLEMRNASGMFGIRGITLAARPDLWLLFYTRVVTDFLAALNDGGLFEIYLIDCLFVLTCDDNIFLFLSI